MAVADTIPRLQEAIDRPRFVPVAECSLDTDLAIFASPKNLTRLQNVLDKLSGYTKVLNKA
jgi:hypothetical protein